MQNHFSRFCHAISYVTGRPATSIAAVLLIGLWAIAGPWFDFSEVWQLVVNTATTIITFLMVFVLQNSQNRDGEAVQAKLAYEDLHELRRRLTSPCDRAEAEARRRGHTVDAQ